MAGKRKKKVRVELRKNRGKRSRIQNLTRQAADDAETVEDLEAGERISGKGALSRRRTIIADTDDGDVRINVDDEQTFPGRVLKAIGANNCRVQGPDGQLWDCTVRRLVRSLAREERSAVVAGDLVQVTETGPDTGVIERVEPRTSALTRGSRYRAHVIVANVDQAVIVASISDPPLKPALIDRFLCSTEKGGIGGIVCLNKCDLGDDVALQPLIGQYAQLGYPVVLTNALDGTGVDELRRLLTGRETVFAGQSGVGKSSLLNAIQPGLSRPTQDVARDSGKGRHTTRVTELLSLHDGGWVVDTPGIRQLQLWDIQVEEVEGLFREFAPFVAHCRFPDCTHLHEADCGIKEAVSLRMISALRYDSYVRIVTGDDT